MSVSVESKVVESVVEVSLVLYLYTRLSEDLRIRPGLAAVKTLAKEVVANLVTASVSLTHASVPGSSSDPSQELKVDEIEVGTGIHNEPGFQKQKIQNASEIVKGLLKQLLDQVDNNRAYVPFKDQDEVVLMINNLGGISTLEMYHLTEVISRQVEDVDGLKILRTYTGSFVTSLDGAGASITLLNLTNLKDSKTVLQYLDLPTDAPGWNSAVQSSNWSFKNPETVTSPVARERAKEIIPIDSKLAESAINGACNSLITAEPEITQYDTVAGDGDAGTTLKSASQAALKHGKISSTNLVDLFGDIAAVLEGSMGGTGGALYTIYFAALSSALPASSSSETTTTTSADVRMMAEAVQMALDRLATYITATIGDKPLMDALIPFSESLSSTRSFPKAVEAAKAGASSTRGMAALLGRATYVESSATLTVPDAVAAGVWKLVQGILDSSDHSKSW